MLRRVLVVLAGLLVVVGLGLPAGASAEGCSNEALREAQHSTGLPDCRAYELVSPVDKAGGDVAAFSTRTRAAADGSAVDFESAAGFGDVRGMGVGADYLSVRSTVADPGGSGWSTHGITPPQAPQTVLAGFQGQEPLYEGELSADLSSGVFRAWSPLTDAPMVANVENLYVRHDLRTPGAGSYQLASDCPACGSPLPAIFPTFSTLPFLDGASADFSHVLFESVFKLTPEAVEGRPNLYESVDGAVRLEGILPDSACGSPPCPAPRSKAGQGAGAATGNNEYTLRTISADGSRVFFTVGADNNAISGALYMRDDHGTLSTVDDSTVQINASERTDCADQNPCSGAPEPDPGGPQPATFWSASTDGARAFFTTSEQLTDDDHNGVADLYMYDSSAPVGHNLTRLSINNGPSDPPVSGVLGTSADGHYVYFLAEGQLIAGKPLGIPSGLYVWHDGSLRYIGAVGDEVFNMPSTSSVSPLRSRVTPDGKHLLFISKSGAGLLSEHGGVDYEQHGFAEFYLYDAVTDSLACASCSPSGAPPTSDVDNTGLRVGAGSSSGTWHLNHPLSDDGRFVFFNAADALVPGDVNGKIDAYEFDALTGTVRLISSGRDPGNSYFLDASANGRDVFFVTREQLVGWDLDGAYDLYDARVSGGFPEPVVAPAVCGGEACQGAPGGVPGAVAPASLGLSGAGNLAPVVSRPALKAKTKAKPRKSRKRKPRKRRVKRRGAKGAGVGVSVSGGRKR